MKKSENEKLEPVFVGFGIDGKKAYAAAKILGYKYIIQMQPNEEGKDAAWLIPNEEDLIECCKMINIDTGFYYKVHLLNKDIDLPSYLAN